MLTRLLRSHLRPYRRVLVVIAVLGLAIDIALRVTRDRVGRWVP